MKIAAVVLGVVLLLVGCTDKPTAQKVLENNGYTEIKIGGWTFGCGDDDTFATEFWAKAPAGGKRVHGVVCEGFWIKGETIRFLD